MKISDSNFVSNGIAKIKVPLLSYDSETKKQFYSWGTGFPIAHNMVITARHLLFPEGEERDESAKIEVIFSKYDSEGNRVDKDPLTATPCHISEECHDIVVLSIEESVENWQVYHDLLAHKPPNNSDEFTTYGYPLKAKFLEDAIPVKGKFIGVSSEVNEANKIYFNVDSNNLKPDDWKGISGAPLFINGKLAGLFKVHTNYTDSLFLTPSIPYLIEKNEGFKTFYSEKYIPEIKRFSLSQKERMAIEGFNSVIERRFRDNPDFVQSLLSKLGGSSIFNTPKEACDFIRNYNIYEVLQNLVMLVGERYNAENSGNLLEVVDLALDVANWLLIFTIDSSFVFPEDIGEEGRISVFDDCDPRFVEVVIARDIPRKPEFYKTKKGLKSGLENEFNPLAVYDSMEVQVQEFSVLAMIFKGLDDTININEYDLSDIPMLIQDIKAGVLNILDRRGMASSGYVYYVIDKKSVNVLREYNQVRTLQRDLKNQLRFIAINKNKSNKNISNYDDVRLLGLIRELLNYKQRLR